jgi:phosphoglycolate phosphatase
MMHPPLSGVRTLAFDLDGTLIDSLPGIARSLHAAFTAVGKTVPAGDLSRIVGPPIRRIALILDPSLEEGQAEEIARVFRSDYDSQGWRSTVLYSGVAEGLRRMQESGLRLFIVTNKPSLVTGQILEHFDLSAYFDAVFTRNARTPQYASKAEMLADLLNQFSVSASEAVMIGDTQEDLEAAVVNRLRFVHAAYGYGTASGATAVLNAFDEIQNLIGLGDARV